MQVCLTKTKILLLSVFNIERKPLSKSVNLSNTIEINSQRSSEAARQDRVVIR